MSLGKTADKLMYAPFVGVYEVPDEIRNTLTMDEFFGNDGCYVEPNFEEQIRALKKSFPDDMKGEDWPLSVEELIDTLKDGKDDLKALRRWVDNDGNGIFCILGDAGTGKSTYLHHLNWSQKDIDWIIIDLKKSVPNIDFAETQFSICWEDFVTLQGKVLASLIQEIRDFLFVNDENGNFDYIHNRQTLQFLLNRYDERIANVPPLREYASIYEMLKTIPYNKETKYADRDYCFSCCDIMTKHFTDVCQGSGKDRNIASKALKCIVTHYLIILRCFEKVCDKKSVIILDNIERFIGEDEIYNKELSDFIQNIRSICDQYRERYIDKTINTNRFSAKYQFIISMRNTTVRNHTPAEMTDFKRHTINLSNWFPVNKIIDAKLEWYKRNGISVIDKNTENHLMYILNDLGVTTRNELRGLRPKLDLIFNYNKRNIVNFLVNALEDCSPEDRMNTIDTFYPLLKESRPIFWCARFGYRSVIWRFILDQLRKEKLFSEGILQTGNNSKHPDFSNRIPNINYIWKLLTVLYRYSFFNREENQKNSELEKYMPFLDLIASVYNEYGNFTSRFYEDGFQIERERMARLLFYMNSYDVDANEWFQFVDIQYNTDSLNRKHLQSWKDLLKVFEEAKNEPQKLKIRITTAGKAYLRVIAPTFEFVSCVSGKRPLLCCLPTEQELKNKPLNKQRCMLVIQGTIIEIKKFIEDAEKQSNNHNLLLQWNLDSEGMTYAKRLIHSSYGYLTNFKDCVSRLVTVSDKTAQQNKEDLIKLIVSEADNLWRTYFPNERFG